MKSDMTTGSPGKTLLLFAIPMVFGNLFQQLYNIIDSIIVGNYVGADALAAVGASTSIVNLFVAIVTGLSAGGAVVNFTAQNIGAGKYERVGKGLKAGLLLSSSIAIGVSALLILFGDTLVGLFVNSELNPKVIETGTQYLHVVGVCYIIMGGMNNVNAALRGAGDVNRTFVNTLCNFGTRVILAYGLASVVGPSVIWYSIPAGWMVALIMGTVRYRGGRWKQIKVVN